MNALPSSFLVVNHEGIHRCSLQIDQLTDFDQFIAKFNSHRVIVLKNLAAHPCGQIHVAVHTREDLPIVILEANKGKLGLQTTYAQVKGDVAGESWISPVFELGHPHSFDLRCEFDFEIWAKAGFKMFFALNRYDYALQIWTWWQGQNYRVPFGNVYDTGAVCVGINVEKLFQDIPPLAGLDEALLYLGSSNWNGDAFSPSWIKPISQLVRFDSKSLKMLPPLNPELITKLGVMAHPMLADVTGLLYG